ncbi:MAG: LCP family protein [Candidatus Levyibacteriota bacterium]
MGEDIEVQKAPVEAKKPPAEEHEALLERIIGNRKLKDPTKIPQIIKDVKSLVEKKFSKDPATKRYLEKLFNGEDCSLREALVESVTENNKSGKKGAVLEDIALAKELLRMNKFPAVSAFFSHLEKKYQEPAPEPQPQVKPGKKGLDTKVKAGLAATAALSGLSGAVAFHSNLEPPPRPAIVRAGAAKSLSNLQKGYQVKEKTWPDVTATTSPTIAATETPKPLATATQTPKPTETKAPLPTTTNTPKPTNTPRPSPTSTETPKPTSTPETKIIKKDLLREKVVPIIYHEVLKIRAERAKNNPEYLQRINPELNQNRINFLLLGGREGNKLSDSIQILSYHIPSHSVYTLSIPRDLQSPEVLKKSGSPQNSRINQAVAYGGTELAKIAMENLSGLSMDMAAIADFSVLVDLIDKTVGKVEVEIDKPINDPAYPALVGSGFDPFYISAGVHQLDGPTALKVARSRHSSSDYARSERQQKIIKALFKGIVDQGEGETKALQTLSTIKDILHQKVAEGTLKPDFDLDLLAFDKIGEYLKALPDFLVNKFFGTGWRITNEPNFFSGGISNKNFVVGGDVPGLSITKLRGGNPNSANPRKDYYSQTRQYTEQLLTQNVGEAPVDEEIKISVHAKEERILYPQELSYGEVKRWIGMLRDSHDSVLAESLFIQELANLSTEKREEILHAIARANAKALIKHYGDTETIIGLDPGHGGTDTGSSGKTAEGKILAEKDLTWQLSQMIAQEIYGQTNGKYTVVVLRPENPNDTDLDGDGIISPIERIQKRKALLLQMEEKLKPDFKDRGKNIVYLSIHFNGSPDPSLKGIETYWPNETAVYSQEHRDSSKGLAQKIQQATIDEINRTGYQAQDRGAKEDPDKRQPMTNADPIHGPYVALGSEKLDRDLQAA